MLPHISFTCPPAPPSGIPFRNEGGNIFRGCIRDRPLASASVRVCLLEDRGDQEGHSQRPYSNDRPLPVPPRSRLRAGEIRGTGVIAVSIIAKILPLVFDLGEFSRVFWGGEVTSASPGAFIRHISNYIVVNTI